MQLQHSLASVSDSPSNAWQNAQTGLLIPIDNRSIAGVMVDALNDMRYVLYRAGVAHPAHPRVFAKLFAALNGRHQLSRSKKLSNNCFSIFMMQ